MLNGSHTKMPPHSTKSSITIKISKNRRALMKIRLRSSYPIIYPWLSKYRWRKMNAISTFITHYRTLWLEKFNLKLVDKHSLTMILINPMTTYHYLQTQEMSKVLVPYREMRELRYKLLLRRQEEWKISTKPKIRLIRRTKNKISRRLLT